ncbi:C40 family peptidase [Amycolatopsis aidingensis]|uniref:C40 family peptidase n=1 Tax=Amycolatopsis aidingensis TaxID=2842453 RepID=UPI001C0CBC6F|nr:C40 family peptidase [Amycolatopsis aidingensis]
MSVLIKLAAAAAVALLLPLVIIVLAVGGIASVFSNSSSTNACAPTGAPTTNVAGYGPEQTGHAATIVAVGKQMHVPEYGWIIAVATAMQESGLRNLNYGDRDSLGLFQQRPSMGWGTPQQVTDPGYAATQFYNHLLKVPNWEHMSVTAAAQAVQRSAFPSAYAKHEPAARAIVAAVGSGNSHAVPGDHGQFVSTCITTGTGDCANIQAPTPAAMTAINYACGQRGLPYVWGGNGTEDGGFDCSGLTAAAYRAAGITLPRTAHAQFHAGPRVPAGQPLLPGDLVFYGNPNTKIHHVGLYIGGGLMIDAPDFGQVVKIQPYARKDYAGATRPAGFLAE